jgi:pimeloyl-ACP methyl ester carboxylesterase
MDRRQHLHTFASLGLLGPTFPASAALAQDAKPDRVKFNSYDGVTLEGFFYPGSLGKKGSTFLFLHQPKTGSAAQEGWGSLADALTKQGHSCLIFDFRGHGNSTSVSPDFWNLNDDFVTGLPGHPHNKLLGQTAATRKSPNISASAFPPKYFYTLVNDIAAAKMFLDERNDKGDCNTSSLYVVAEGEACALASLWMASQFSLKKVDIASSGPRISGTAFRPRISQIERITKTYPAEGLDLLAGIWLSYKPSIAGLVAPVDRWIKEISLARGKYRTQMMFVYGAKDTETKNHSKRYLASIRPGYDPDKAAKDSKPGDKPANKPPVKTASDQLYTLGIAIPDCNLSGIKLLRPEFSTTTSIAEYVTKLGEARTISESVQRNNRSASMIWQQQANGPVLVAKMEGESMLRATPIQLWGAPAL